MMLTGFLSSIDGAPVRISSYDPGIYHYNLVTGLPFLD